MAELLDGGMAEVGPMGRDALEIVRRSIEESMPFAAVGRALADHAFAGDVYLAAIGKAAWPMAKAAHDALGGRVAGGVVLTKYSHSKGAIGGLEIREAGHPVADENSVAGTEAILGMADRLKAGDELLFLISGGGSALFEKPLDGLTLGDLNHVNERLLASGAGIVEVNAVRKRLSAVKAGRFACRCEPARVYCVVLSDVLGDRLDSIASGPAAPDMTTSAEALGVVRRYGVALSGALLKCLEEETPKEVKNVASTVAGSVASLCRSAADAARGLGYEPHVLCVDMDCEASAAGRMASAIARQAASGQGPFRGPCAIVMGGETTVRVTGKGKGGRNQELALAAAMGIEGMRGAAVLALGSDGTDGPTDAAGGIVDGGTAARIKAAGRDPLDCLADNDSYGALRSAGALLVTGPTGTNVNDVAVVLVR